MNDRTAFAQESVPEDGNYWNVVPGPVRPPQPPVPVPVQPDESPVTSEQPVAPTQPTDSIPQGASAKQPATQEAGREDTSGFKEQPSGSVLTDQNVPAGGQLSGGSEESPSVVDEKEIPASETGQEAGQDEEEIRAEQEAMARGIEARYRAGYRAQRRGRFYAAERAYLSVLKDAPQHFRSLLQLGILYLERDPEAALAHLRIAERVFPSNASVHYVLGQALEALGYDLDAAEAYRQAIYRNPRHYNANTRLRGILRRLRSRQTVVQRAAEAFNTNPSLATLTLFGRIVMEHSSPRQAVLEFERVRKVAPELSETDLWLARALNAAGDTKGEVEAYTRYLERHGNAVGVRLLLVERMVDWGRFRRAAELLKPVVQPSFNGGIPPSARGRAAFLQSRLLSARQRPSEAGELLLKARELRYDAEELSEAFRKDLALYPKESSLWMDFGRFLLSQGNPAGAAEALGRAGQHDPGLRQAAEDLLKSMLTQGQAPEAVHLALGAFSLSDDDPEGALVHLAQVPLGHPLDPEASLLRGRIHRKRGELDAALDDFLRYLLHFRERNDLIWARGNLYWELGRLDEALAVWNENPDVLLDHPHVLLKIAARHQERGDATAEMATRERLVQALPGNMVNRIRLGELYEGQGRRREALETWQAVLEERPHDPELLLRTARGWFGYNETKRGLNLMHLASEMQPLDPEDSELLARALYKEQRFEDALTVYWGLYREQPNHPDLPRVLPELALNVPATIEMRRTAAELAHKAGRFQQAVELLEALLQDLPRDREAREQLAVVYLEQNKPDQAVRVLLDSGSETGMNEESLELLAKVQERAGRWVGLAATLEDLAAFRPGDIALKRRRTLVLVRLNLNAEARPLLESLIKAEPGDEEVHMALAQVSLAEGDADVAHDHFQAVLTKNPSHQGARKAMIDLLTSRAKWEELPPHLEVWVASHPKDAKARYNLISAYLKDFRTEAARPHYEVLRKQNPGRARSLDPYFR